MATTASFLVRGQFVIAVVGATGRLGKNITTTLSKSYKHQLSRVIALTRDVSSNSARELSQLQGVDVRAVSFSRGDSDDENHLSRVLQGVDVVVNALGAGSSAAEKDAVLEAAVNANVKIYFPSEFGVDHRENDRTFPSFDHPEWIKKRKHLEYANELVNGRDTETKIICIYCGLFLEMVFAEWSGLDASKRTFTFLSPSASPPFPRVSITSTYDVAHAIASLVPIFMAPQDLASSLPTHIRIAGNRYSVPEIADIYKDATGVPIALDTCGVSEEKEKLKQEMVVKGEGWSGAPGGHIRILMGEGLLDFADNSNELVNPNGTRWAWKDVKTFIREQHPS